MEDALPAEDEWTDVKPEATRVGTRTTIMHVVLGINLAFLGLNFLAAIFVGIVQMVAPDGAMAKSIAESLANQSARDLWFNTALAFLMMGIIPFAWTILTRSRPWLGAQRYLGLEWTNAWRDAAIGVAIATIALMLVFGMSYGLEKAGLFTMEDDDNPAVQGILAHLTWPLAIAIALGAGIGEEILFRGVLQRWIGWWPQALLFGLAHFTGAYWPQIIVTLIVGFSFGWMRHKGLSLWALIVAHVLYDFALLALALSFG